MFSDPLTVGFQESLNCQTNKRVHVIIGISKTIIIDYDMITRL